MVWLLDDYYDREHRAYKRDEREKTGRLDVLRVPLVIRHVTHCTVVTNLQGLKNLQAHTDT